LARRLSAFAQERYRRLELQLSGPLLDSLVRLAKGRLVLGEALGGTIVH
jgi:hypothetical protein